MTKTLLFTSRCSTTPHTRHCVCLHAGRRWCSAPRRAGPAAGRRLPAWRPSGSWPSSLPAASSCRTMGVASPQARLASAVRQEEKSCTGMHLSATGTATLSTCSGGASRSASDARRSGGARAERSAAAAAGCRQRATHRGGRGWWRGGRAAAVRRRSWYRPRAASGPSCIVCCARESGRPWRRALWQTLTDAEIHDHGECRSE